MFDFIKSTYKKGDKLRLTSVNGEFIGEILFISEDSIILKTNEGKTCGIKGCDISFFEEETTQSVLIPGENAETEKHDQDTGDISSLESVKNEDVPTDTTIDQKQDNVTSTTKEVEEKIDQDNKPKLKIIGKIDLEALDRPTRPQKSKKNKDKSKPTMTLKGLESLKTLVEEDHKRDNEKYVPALGEISYVNIEGNFGFITDGKTNKKVFFSFGQIVDSKIQKTSGFLYRLPVIYSIIVTEKGEKAVSIHRPAKIVELIKIAEEQTDSGNYRHAVRVLEHILNEYPDNFTADRMKTTILKSHPQSKPRVYTDLYAKAKKYHLAKDFDKAIEFFIKSIEAGEKLESSIKDLGSLYVELYSKSEGEQAETYRDKAIQLLNDHEKDLSNSLSTLNYLESIYYSIKYYDAFIEIAQELLDRKELIKDKARSSLLLCKIATAYVRMDDLDNASKAIDEALSNDPNNIGAIKLKDALVNDNVKDIVDEISATEFDSLNSGLSSFIQQTLENYDEYFGVPPKIIESGDFNEVTLNEIRKQIDTAGRARPRERAQYLLTEGKLMLSIEPDNENRLRSVMARYCNAMALNHISNYSSMDITRFYYNEAFSLEHNYRLNTTQVALYLLSHCCTASELLNLTAKSPSVDEALTRAISSDTDMKSWESILSMFLNNPEISARIVSILFAKPLLQKKAIIALHYFDSNNRIAEYQKEQFIEAWNNVRDKRIREYKQAIASIKSICDCKTIDEFILLLGGLSDIRRDWMTSLDASRIRTIVNNILPALRLYIKSTGYRNKESNRSNAYHQILQLREEISEGPTKVSFEALLPLLEKASVLLDDSFQDVLKMSAPKINISLLSEATVINNNNTVTIQVSISNHIDSSPIREVEVGLLETNDIKMLKSNDLFYNMIEGGDSQIFKLQFEVSDKVISQKATAVTIICNYKSDNESQQTSAQRSLKFYSEDEFSPIENPYAPIADGGPVPLDSNMFFGRETEIENIVDAIIKSPSKQIIIYGQKRSGKSSVMYRLKQRLLDTGQTFCVLFSLGDIIQNLSEASFYYKILSSIKQELTFLEIDGIERIPPFEIPTAKEFKDEDEDNPSNTFSKYMINFKLSCKQTDGWQHKNLVVLIDEFTYLYTAIKKGDISDSIMKQWKAITQNDRAQFSVVLVGQDVVPSFKKEDYARNAFGVIQDMRLTYLKDEPARALIETPIKDEDGKSRYIGDAVSRIIEYTSRNPYYIQIFCSRLVDFMNSNKLMKVTEADVNEVARSFIYGSDALEEDKFDNLIRAGESEDLQEYSESDILAILRQIALNSKNVGYCNRADIDVFEDKVKEDAIIKDLYDREVLEMKGEDNYKIQVKLFQEWLLNH